MTPQEQFRHAKVDHFLERAEDLRRMARFPAARRAVDLALALDPGNPPCLVSREEIEQNLADFAHHGNGNGTVFGHEKVREDNGIGRPGGSLKRGESVLMVDQDEQVLLRFAGSLRKHGYRFLGAGSYEEALEILSLTHPDIVVSEVNFEQGALGFDLFLWMRTNTPYVGIPFLFHATRIDRDVLIAGKRFGVDDFIVKPADDDVIAAAVAQSLLRRRQAIPVR
jgi:PleD family two-component response regulator